MTYTKQDLDLLSAKDILQVFVESHEYYDKDEDYQVDNFITNNYYNEPFISENLTLTLINEIGGGEGEGEYVQRVFEIKLDNVVYCYIMISGYYASYDGTTWDDEYEFVQPFEKVVIDFEVVKERVDTVKKLK